MPYISVALRQQVANRAKHRCEYCQSAELVTSGPMHVEHIIPISQDGTTNIDNLAFACARCNLHKAARMYGKDPITEELVPLFHPRLHQWSEHFFWSHDKVRVEAHTSIGRVTVIVLNMNDLLIVMSRNLWVTLGVHPPMDV